MKKLAFLIFVIGCVGIGFSQQLVYKPVNPNFGGDTFNYQQLLSSANAQNSFTNPDSRLGLSDLDNFSESINRQVLGQLSRAIFGQQLGQGLQAGTYSLGTLSLEIFDSAEGLVINILDITTGEQTQIVVPQ
ncbi:MAG: curli assembly protein CsgF [Flavobacteriaceae bacterium]|nr:curli assembly protein CsgF [Flavobacteriaceae bacterium]|tara:strand:- start:18719 stop:19114 length:396 start_codon:yes stop_codon:yes gene_type:complete